jgi:hypothetical protein
VSRAALRGIVVCALAGAAAFPADAPLAPVTVCEVVRDLPAREGQAFAIVGRYSFRSTGRSLGEQACDPAVTVPPQLRLVEDRDGSPKPPDSYELDAAELRRKLADIQKRTSLGKFRFGSPEYDRWAVVFGRVEAAQGADALKMPANLVFRGDGVVMFLAAQQ